MIGDEKYPPAGTAVLLLVLTCLAAFIHAHRASGVVGTLDEVHPILVQGLVDLGSSWCISDSAC